MRTITPQRTAALFVFCIVVTSTLIGGSGEPPKKKAATDRAEIKLRKEFAGTVQPFIKQYCAGCHGKKKRESMLDLRRVADFNRANEQAAVWQHIREKLKARAMPPEDARQPRKGQRQVIVAWIDRMLKFHADRNAGDPGPVLARRLSAAEYNYTVRDLTGVDIRPAKQFPIDPTNEAGFDNSGESLAMTPALLRKYLSAARYVADHVVLKPRGFVFAQHPTVGDTEKDKYCVNRIIAFYKAHRVDYADYLAAAWRYKHRDQRGESDITLKKLAAENKLSLKYLTKIWTTFAIEKHRAGPLKVLQRGWNDLPATLSQKSLASRCQALRDQINTARSKLTHNVGKVTVKGLQIGSQSVVLWKDRQMAAARMKYVGKKSDSPARKKLLNHFCSIFPDTFVVTERGRVFLDPKKQNKGRLLSAGFHLMVGYFRDDRPLYELVLNRKQQQTLDTLWAELDFVTRTPIRQYKDFVYYERAESPRILQASQFDFARPENKDITSPAKMKLLRKLYVEVVRKAKATPQGLQAVEKYFRDIYAAIRRVEKERRQAEPSHLEALVDFAGRAYRRSLQPAERTRLQKFYRSLRKEGLEHEEAIRDCLTSILMSPYFCYRTLGPTKKSVQRKPGQPYKSEPLSDFDLASRLSYFLWSSMPDKRLLSLATKGQLRNRQTMRQEVRRMLRDPRARGFAVEFGGQWLGFRRFEQHNSVDRTRFPVFDDRLRQSMFEEPIAFVLDAIQNDRSVLDFLYGKHTFVNEPLAKHYGMKWRGKGWQRIKRADSFGRGGLLPMAVFMTQHSPGLRTSPVKRGYWVVRQLLGERIPPPPPKVPELPEDEAKLGNRTLRQVLAQHRSIKSCAACHERFDAIGLVFEGFGPVGERRAKDLGGRAVDTRANFPGGSTGQGLAGLQNYLRRHRQAEFVDNLCRKLLAYSLGRTLLLSDEPLITSMKKRLRANDYRFGTLIETIVSSRQFREQRSG